MCSNISVFKCTDKDILSSVPTLTHFTQELPRIYQGDIQQLGNEWRSLPNIYVPEDIKAQNDPEVFFEWLANKKNDEGTLMYTPSASTLCTYDFVPAH